MNIVEELRERAVNARQEGNATAEADARYFETAAALIEKMAEALRSIELEAGAGIAGEPIYKGYPDHNSVPNGLRTVAHIKFSMIRECARDILKELGQ